MAISNIPDEEMARIINDIVAHEEMEKEKEKVTEDNLEYLYLDYKYEEDDLEDIIKISL